MDKKTYLTVLSNRKYLPGVIALGRSLQAVDSHYPLTVLVPRGSELGEDLKAAGLTICEAERLTPVDDSDHYWGATFFKLRATGMTQFDKIVLLDSDMLIVRNLDHLFNSPAWSAVAAGRVVHPGNGDWLGLNSGLMVIEPSRHLARALEVGIADAVSGREARGMLAGDQDVFRYVKRDWEWSSNLHLSEAYNCFWVWIDELVQRHLPGGEDDLAVVHFTGSHKPWMYSDEESEALCAEEEKAGRHVAAKYWRRYRELLPQ